MLGSWQSADQSFPVKQIGTRLPHLRSQLLAMHVSDNCIDKSLTS